MFDLSNKVAVITGGCSGIGRGTIDVFQNAGAKVVCFDIQDDKGAAIDTLLGDNGMYVHVDVTSQEQMEAGFAKVMERFGRIDTLFNNAGGSEGIGTDPFDIDALHRTQDLLVTSVILGMKYAVPVMAAQGGGSIVNTASIAGLQAGYGGLAYSLAKSSVVHLSRVSAASLAQQKIRVNAICPGLIPTSIFGRVLGDSIAEADQRAAMIAENAHTAQPIPQAGKPEDIGHAVAFFASDEASFVTGQYLAVDGGITTGPRSAWDVEASGGLWRNMGMTEEQMEEIMNMRSGG